MKKETTCTQCFEPFAWKAISDDDGPVKIHVFCSQKCRKAWHKIERCHEVAEIDGLSWKQFVKLINEKR